MTRNCLGARSGFALRGRIATELRRRMQMVFSLIGFFLFYTTSESYFCVKMSVLGVPFTRFLFEVVLYHILELVSLRRRRDERILKG